MRIWFGLICLMLGISEVFAALLAPTVPAIGLVLGGGGARGAAHIGVLKVLERERVPIAFIAGTSMGAIVGGMYAAGYNAAQIEERLETTDWEEILRDAPARRELPLERKNDSLDLLANVQFGIGMDGLKLPRGLIQGQKLLMTFQLHLLPVTHIRDFDQLAIPFRCVASNLADGSPVVFADGDLPFAIRASMSVPALFQPVRDGQKRMLVDGMLASNVPVGVARSMGATRLIVVDVGESLLPTKDLNSPISVTNQVLSILLRDKTEAELATLSVDDLLIRPELGDTSTADFPLTASIIDMGQAAAEQALVGIRRFSVDSTRYAAFTARHQLPSYRAEKIAYLKMDRSRSRSARNVEAQMSALIGRKLNVKRVERAIQAAYGDGRYERITYQTERDNKGRLGLSVLPVDKGWGPNFLRFGFALDDDFAGRSNYRLSAELRLTGRNKFGGEWRNRLDLGKESGLRSEFLQPYGPRNQFYLRPFVDTRTRLRQVGALDELPFEFRTRSYSAGLEVGFDFDSNRRMSAELTRGRDYARLVIGADDAFPSIDSDYGRLQLGFTRDTLDDSSFPHDGSRVDAHYALYRKELGGDADAQVLSIAADQARSFGRHTLLYGARFSRPLGDEQPVFQALQSLGGLGNLSGYTDDRLLGEAVGLARLVYYRRFGAADKLFSAPVYLGASLEAGNAWNDVDDACLCNLLGAGSLFFGVDTFFGPMYLGYGRASSGSDAVYLSFGSLAFGRR